MSHALLFEEVEIYKCVHHNVPGMPLLDVISKGLRGKIRARAIGLGFAHHRKVADRYHLQCSPYQNMRRGIIPSYALAACALTFLPDLKFTDYWGLTDAAIAHDIVLRPNSRCQQAHDRSTPPGYLAAWGVNFIVYPATASEERALGRGGYAVQPGPDLWIPFDALSLEWATARFAQLRYDQGANGRFEAMMKTARLLTRDVLNVYLDGNRLLYVKD